MCKFFEKISIFLMICLTQPCLFKFYSEFSKSFLKILLTSYRLCAIIANASGCGAVGSALPWGGRGRWFKSSHSDQKVRWLLNFRTFYFSILQLSAKVITKVITSSFRIHWFSYMFKYIQKGYLVRYPFYLSYDFKSIVKVFAKGNSS